MDQQDLAVEISNVSFYYNHPRRVRFIRLPFLKHLVVQKHLALDNVSVKIRKNRVTGLLGRNGSGKTSLIKLISGIRLPHKGSISLFGADPIVNRQKIGICLGSTLIYYRLSGRQNLEYFGRLYRIENLERKIDQLTELLGLGESIDDMVETFSFGMKTKLAIARSLLHNPEILILDEPTLGIDIYVAREIRSFVKNLQSTVLLTSHYVEEIEQLAQDIIVLDSGRLIDYGSKQEVLGRAKCGSIPELFEQLGKDPHHNHHSIQYRTAV